MDLSLTEQQELLKTTARDFMEREASKDTLLELEETESGYSDELWQKASDIGWLGMLVPEQYGGSGNSLTDAAVVFEQMGAGPLSGPFFSSGVLGALTVLEAGSEEQRQRYLPSIAVGREIATLALTEPDYGWGPDSVSMRAQPTDNGYVLSGTKLFVHDAASATTLITAVRARGYEGVTLMMVDANTPGVSTRLLPGFLGWVGEVIFDSVEVPADAVLGEPGSAWQPLHRAIQKAIPILCAYKVGGSQAVFDMTLEYSRTRIQFSNPIGRFQRVQDHIINIINHLDAARWATYEALWKLDSNTRTGNGLDTSIHLAKTVTSEGYYQACNAAHEVHAGIGVMQEYGLTLHTKMSRTLYHYMGDPRFHRKRMAETLNF
jgi:alkylation response protein AidB-like acyl-CoA dehydrogenase